MNSMKNIMFPKKILIKVKSNRKKKWQKELFEKIWNERLHICVKCWKHLLEAKSHNFAHIKPKWMYPELKFEESNIELLCFNCHYNDTTWLTNKWIDIW